MKQFFSIILFFALLVPGVVFAQSDLQPVATVNLVKTESITVKQWRAAVERMEKLTGQSLTASQRREVLDGLINEKLFFQAAERDKITVVELEVTQQVNQLRAQLAQGLGRQPTDAEFAAAVQNQYGVDIPAFREQVRSEMLLQKYLLAKKQDVFNAIKIPTEEEIRNHYNLIKSQLTRPDTVRLSMIQVPYGADSASRTRAKELVDRLYREIGSEPSKFDEAVIRAQAQGSGYQGGERTLGRNLQNLQMVGEEFMNIAFSVKQGEVSKVIEGLNAYQIIKVRDSYPQKNLELDDIYQIGANVTVRDFIGNGLLQARTAEAREKALKELSDELRKGNPFRIIEANLNQ
jgi:parvulin-like peptidyl-prolyl isomerase